MPLIKIRAILKKFKQYDIDEGKKTSVDILTRQVNPDLPLEERIEWIQDFFKWIRYVDFFDQEPEKSPLKKIKFILMVLERNPEIREKFSSVFTSTLQELSATEFFCEVGLPAQSGLLGELSDKIISKILPKKPIGYQLSELLTTLFPTENDARWIKAIDDTTLDKISLLLNSQGKNTYPHLRNDIEESLLYLVSQVVAIGLSPGIRKRIPHKKMKSLPFFYLAGKLGLYLKLKNDLNANPELQIQVLNEFHELLAESKLAIKEVYSHFDRFGVSSHLVFQLERMKLFILRIESLLEITDTRQTSKTKITNLLAELIEQNLSHQSATGILSNNATLLAQRIIETNSQTGEHYIAKDQREYNKMVLKAIGGGALTAFTVFIKNFLAALPVTKFIIGLLASLNYSGSFLLIQFCGFTLATKQPAATASALADKLDSTENLESIEELTDEIVLMTRTQIAAVLGNLLAVIPTVLAVCFIYLHITGKTLFDNQTANYTLHSTDIFGPTIIYAGFTGFLLWLSSIASGWADNWYSFNQINFLIINNKKIKTVLGVDGAKKLASFLKSHITGIAGNISLGVLLGFLPEILKFIGIPLEVRHVTLSTGALSAAAFSLGFDVLSNPEFTRAVLGIFLIGFLNLLVSFSLALIVAIKAKKISSLRRVLIYRSVIKRFFQKPFSFFIPKSST